METPKAKGRPFWRPLVEIFPGEVGKSGARMTRHIPMPSWLLVLGLGMLAIAAVAEHPLLLGVEEHGKSLVFSSKTGISFLKEVGFALLIAWGVSAGIERQARERDEENAARTRETIAKDVVHAVYGLQHDPRYVRSVIEVALHSKVVRDFYDCEYTLERLTEAEEAELRVKPGRFLKMTLVSKYSFFNVSNDDVEFDIKYSLAARFGKTFRDFARIKEISIGGTGLTLAQIGEGDKTTPQNAYKSYCWRRSIPARQTVEVVVHAVSIKELSDNEIWGSYHGTYKGMDLVVHVRVPGLRYGIRDLTATPARTTYDHGDGNARWEIQGPILPNESVVFWWRSPEDDGEPEGTEGITAS